MNFAGKSSILASTEFGAFPFRGSQTATNLYRESNTSNIGDCGGRAGSLGNVELDQMAGSKRTAAIASLNMKIAKHVSTTTSKNMTIAKYVAVIATYPQAIARHVMWITSDHTAIARDAAAIT